MMAAEEAYAHVKSHVVCTQLTQLRNIGPLASPIRPTTGHFLLMFEHYRADQARNAIRYLEIGPETVQRIGCVLGWVLDSDLSHAHTARHFARSAFREIGETIVQEFEMAPQPP